MKLKKFETIVQYYVWLSALSPSQSWPSVFCVVCAIQVFVVLLPLPFDYLASIRQDGPVHIPAHFDSRHEALKGCLEILPKIPRFFYIFRQKQLPGAYGFRGGSGFIKKVLEIASSYLVLQPPDKFSISTSTVLICDHLS